MPQLMPLPWLYSVFMVFMFFFCMSFIYSNFSVNFNSSLFKINKNLILWYW